MDFPFSIITGKTIHRLVHEDLQGCVQVVKDAYLAHGQGKSVNPNSFFLRFPEDPSARIIGLPAHLGDRFSVSGIKWIASYPKNVQKGFPRASAVLILNSDQTGYPFACLESSIISAARTAASAALAADWLTGRKKQIRSLGIVGTGLIARYVHTFLRGVGFELPEVRLFDLVPAEAEKFKQTALGAHAGRVVVDPDLPTLMKASDCVLFTTVAGKPHVQDAALLAHHPLVLHVSLRDLAPELLLQSNNVVDDVGHVMNADTSAHLAEKLTGGRAFVNGTLAEIMTGKAELDPNKPTIFSPFGLGVLDLAVGKWVYERALASNEAVQVPDFFFEVTR